MSEFEDLFQPYSLKEIKKRKKKYPPTFEEITLMTPNINAQEYTEQITQIRRELELKMRIPTWMMSPVRINKTNNITAHGIIQCTT